MAYDRRSFAAAAVRTEIAAAIGASDQSFDIVLSTGWPDGSSGKFYAVIDEGLSSEEKILVTTRSTSTLLGVTRGADGTQTFSHSAGAAIRLMFAGVDLDEANYWVSELATAASAANDLIIADADNGLSQLAKGSNSTVLGVSSGGSLGYSTVTSAQITDGTIVNGDINASAAVSLSKLETIATGRLVGNISGGSAAPTAVALSTPTTVRKTSNQTIPASTTNTTTISGLSFTTTSGVPYLVDGVVVFASGGDDAFDLNFDADAGEGIVLVVVETDAGAPFSGALSTNASTPTLDLTTVKRAVAFQGWHVGAGGSFTITVTPDSGFGFFFDATFYAGSYLRYRALT